MSALSFEAFLAKIYVDERARARFLADPRGEAMKAGLTAQEMEAAVRIDRIGLEMFAESLDRKRQRRLVKRPGWIAKVF